MQQRIPHILLVEDDPNLGFLLVELLEEEGYRVQLCRTGEEGWTAFQTYNYKLALLDIMLPELDGFHLAQRIRRRNKQMPVIFLTARSLKSDKLKGFDLGADDYICKPFDEDLLLCRIKAVLNRAIKDDQPIEKNTFQLGRFSFDQQRRTLVGFGKERRMTAKETAVLKLLCQSRNQVLKREDVLLKVWGKNDYFLGRSLDVFIAKLRKYLKDDPNIEIENVFGVGFILVEKEEEK